MKQLIILFSIFCYLQTKKPLESWSDLRALKDYTEVLLSAFTSLFIRSARTASGLGFLFIAGFGICRSATA